jgi:hypothetical protein
MNRWMGEQTSPYAPHPPYYSHHETYTVKQSAASFPPVHPKHKIALCALRRKFEIYSTHNEANTESWSNALKLREV